MSSVSISIQPANQLIRTSQGSTEVNLPMAEAVQRFEQALNRGEGAVETSAPISAQPSTRVELPETIGEAILQGMEKIRVDHDHQFHRVKRLVESPGLRQLDFRHAVHLQFELMQLTLHQDITTKSADKTSQGIQTLFRNQ